MSTRTVVGNLLAPLLLPVLLVAAWWFASAGSSSIYFPPLADILETFRQLWLFALVPEHVVPSVTAIGLGLGTRSCSGAARGAAGPQPQRSPPQATPRCSSSGTPAVALLPLAIQLIGLGIEMRVTIIVFGALWPILLNTMDGVRGIHPGRHRRGRSNRVRRGQLAVRMVLPAASPQIFSGIRASLAVSVIVMIASEMLGSSAGLGFFILQAQRQFSLPEMWSGMILLGVIGYLLNVTLLIVER